MSQSLSVCTMHPSGVSTATFFLSIRARTLPRIKTVRAFNPALHEKQNKTKQNRNCSYVTSFLKRDKND